MGLSYFIIGVLISFREIMINIMEIPTGGVADLCGRRNAMVFSFTVELAFAGGAACALAFTAGVCFFFFLLRIVAKIASFRILNPDKSTILYLL